MISCRRGRQSFGRVSYSDVLPRRDRTQAQRSALASRNAVRLMSRFVSVVRLIAMAAVFCFEEGCGSPLFEPVTPVAQNCSTLSSSDWSIGKQANVAVGASVSESLSPSVETQCEGSIVSVTWSIDDPSVASITPDKRSVWITGLAPGLGAINARINFADGAQRTAGPMAVNVVRPEAVAPGSVVVAEGSLTIQPYVPPGNSSRDWSGWAPFTTEKAGRLDVAVDWISPLNRIDFSGYEGHCKSIGTCGMIRLIVRKYGVKPLTATFDDPRTSPGDYTIRIDNLGPGEETVHYEVRLTPN